MYLSKLFIALISCLILIGCRDEQETMVVVSLDWDDIKKREYRIGIGGAYTHSSNVIPYRTLCPGFREINGREYFGYIIEELNSEEKPISNIFSIDYVIIQDDCIYADVLLNTKVNCQISLSNFAKGSIHDAVSKERYNRPYIFKPGEYHLEFVDQCDTTETLTQ